MLTRSAFSLIAMLALLLGGCSSKLTPAETRDLFRRVHASTISNPINGRFTTTVKVKEQTLTAEAQVHRGAGRSVTEYLSGRYKGWKVIEQQGLVWRVDPQGQARAGSGPTAGTSLELGPTMGLKVKRYLTSRKIAGRVTERYVVDTSQRGKARVVLEVDAETGFPLASTRYSSRNRLISRTIFQSIAYGGKAPAKLSVPQVAKTRWKTFPSSRVRLATIAELSQILGGELFQPTELPPGYKQVGTYLRQTVRGPIAELHYSDGLRVMVLLQFEVGQRNNGQQSEGRRWLPPHPGLQKNRPTADRSLNAPDTDDRRQELRSRLRGHMVRERRGTRSLILAGDVEIQELRRVLESIP